jgi:hypothetical protein
VASYVEPRTESQDHWKEMAFLTSRMTTSFSRTAAFSGNSYWEMWHFCWVVCCLLTHLNTLNYELGHYWDVFLAAIILSLALFYHNTLWGQQGFELHVALEYSCAGLTGLESVIRRLHCRSRSNFDWLILQVKNAEPLYYLTVKSLSNSLVHYCVHTVFTPLR